MWHHRALVIYLTQHFRSWFLVEQILRMESEILNALCFQLSSPTPWYVLIFDWSIALVELNRVYFRFKGLHRQLLFSRRSKRGCSIPFSRFISLRTCRSDINDVIIPALVTGGISSDSGWISHICWKASWWDRLSSTNTCCSMWILRWSNGRPKTIFVCFLYLHAQRVHFFLEYRFSSRLVFSPIVIESQAQCRAELRRWLPMATDFPALYRKYSRKKNHNVTQLLA
jgi:hypothetical protein